ncbi:MAG TPA: FGGY-family carbohydrate kinase [Candidatus Nanopelagicus sp.]|jgi:xylulokinase|nr:FGGY-family carbohydrate kinase [Candidatus Nanopelagicus sp.]
MSQDLLLGIDIGTYESKGVLTTISGEVIAQVAVPHKLLFPRAGWAEHDPELTWWGDFCAITKQLLSTPGVVATDVKGVGISAIGPDVLPIDENFNPLRMGILYGVDTRAVKEIDELNAKYGEDEIFNATANCLSSQSTGPKILWIKKNEPEVYKKARWFVDATTFIVARLTSRVVIDHFSAGCMVPMYDPWKNEWSDKFCSDFVDLEQLPEILWSHELAGNVTQKASELTGLAEGTPVSVGTIDAGAEALSVGVTKPGEMMMMYGSTIFMIQVTDNDQAREKRLWAGPYLFPGTWCLLAGMATSGSLTRWFRDQFAPELVAAEKSGGAPAYAELVKEAAETKPGAEGVIVLPYFSGERTPVMDPRAKGMIFGLSLTHSRGHIFRAILEGMGHGVKQHVDLFTSIGARPKTIKSVGGGTKNSIWLQAISDISGVPQEVAPLTFGASYGDALLAGVAVGLVSSPEEIRTWQGKARIISPDEKLAETYRPLSEIYTSLYDATKNQMHKLHELDY